MLSTGWKVSVPQLEHTRSSRGYIFPFLYRKAMYYSPHSVPSLQSHEAKQRERTEAKEIVHRASPALCCYRCKWDAVPLHEKK